SMYSQEYQNNPMLLELVTADILPVSIEVAATEIGQLEQVRADLESSPGIEDVQFQERVVETLRSWTNTARVVGVSSALILAFLSFLIITVIVGMRVSMQRKKISIMRLIGATRWYVKKPFMAEGMIYGLIGSLIGWGIATGVVFYLSPEIKSFVTDISLFPIPLEFLAIQLGAGLVAGMMLGMFAGLAAGQRLIRQ
ncbi:MAG: cell division transport system permease protein, partial [Patescibacteria group bacterium]|nr:cell division transport system permease protein [Patescibacteria group bacterium]